MRLLSKIVIQVCLTFISLYIVDSFGKTIPMDKISIAKEYNLAKQDLEELIAYAFNKGHLCNDEEKAMCIEKTEEFGRTVKRLILVTYFFQFGSKNYIYKVEVVEENTTIISPNEDVPHNIVNHIGWKKYKEKEKYLIKQTIIRDGEINLISGPKFPLDGHPDFILKSTYIKTKDHTLIHADDSTLNVDEDTITAFKKYIREILEYVRNRPAASE